MQFDGSYKPRSKRGGAGAAAFLVDQQQMRLLDWQAIVYSSLFRQHRKDHSL